MANKNGEAVAAAYGDLFGADHDTKPTAKKEVKREKKNEKKAEKKTGVLTCRIGSETLEQWRAYTTVCGKIGELTEQALMDYMKKHPLKQEQEKAYNLAAQLNDELAKLAAK